jgi:hypothetical protein
MRPSMRYCCTGYAWQSFWASSDYSSMATPSQQGVGHQQGHHGRLRHGNTQAREKFLGLEIYHVVRDNSVGPDVLSKLGFDRANVPPGAFVHELHHPSIRTTDSSSIAQDPNEPD